MKLVVAVIKPFKLDEVSQAMHDAGIAGVTVTEVRGHGRQKGHTEVYRGAEYTVEYIPKVRLEILVDDVDVEKVVSAIAGSARTDEIGDGKIWVVPIESALRIRTGEAGSDAL